MEKPTRLRIKVVFSRTVLLTFKVKQTSISLSDSFCPGVKLLLTETKTNTDFGSSSQNFKLWSYFSKLEYTKQF